MTCVQEYHYRKLFGLSKKEMQEEPLDDVTINFKIAHFLSKKQEADHAIVEEKVKRGVKT